MQTIFLSHSSKDTEFAERLAADLRKHNWRARTVAEIVSPETLHHGELLDGRIEQAIEQDAFFIPILTPAAIINPGLRREVEIALNDERHGMAASILPVMKEQCLIPDFLGLLTPSDFTASYENGLASLLEKLSAPIPRSLLQQTQRRVIPFAQGMLRKLKAQQDDLFELSQKEFENLVSQMFKSFGFEIEVSGLTKDGGIDLFVFGIQSSDNHPWLVECKRYQQGKRLSVEPVMSLYKSSSAEYQVRNSLIAITSSIYAYDFATAHLARSRWELSSTGYATVLKWLGSYPQLGSALTQPIEQARERHAELVDKKFRRGLSLAEQNELTRLIDLITEAEEPLYAPLIDELQRIVGNLSLTSVKKTER